jgi:hypothetical protein
LNRNLPRKPISHFIAVLTLVSLLSVTGAGASSAQGNPVTPGTSPAADPTPLYSITYTATGKSFSDVTDEYGARTVKNRKISMAGSAIWRKYAAGGFDTVPFDWTVNDDYDEVVTTPCVGQGGSDRDHTAWTITDPSRYSGGPNMGIIINAPLKRPDGSWYMAMIRKAPIVGAAPSRTSSDTTMDFVTPLRPLPARIGLMCMTG